MTTDKQTTKRIRFAQKLAIFNSNHQLLILRFSDQHPNHLLRGFWDFPGGGLHFFETLEQGLAREIHEELGDITYHLNHPLFAYDWYHKLDPTTRTICLLYQATFQDGQIQLNPAEHDQSAWATIDQLKKYQWEPDNYQAVTNLINHYQD